MMITWPSMDAVAIKSPVSSTQMSTIDAWWDLYDFILPPLRSRR